MKRALAIGLLALFAASPAARAGDPPKDKADAASRAGKTTTSSSTSGAAAKTTSDGGLLDLWAGRPAGKWWELGFGLETHALMRQNDLAGAGPNKLFNYYYLTGKLLLTSTDRITARFGVYERFLADQGESGTRTTDISVGYAHKLKLPWKLALSLGASLTLPISFYSQKQGEVTSMTFSAYLERSFGGATVGLRLFGGPNLARYASAEGGSSNSAGLFGVMLSGEYKLPWVKGLVFGADLYTAYLWHYDVYNAGSPTMSVPTPSVDPTFAHQPVQQSYGGELYVRYELPKWKGLKTEVTLALAQGDPTLGYTSIIHDGVAHLYGFWRTTSEVYGVFGIKY